MRDKPSFDDLEPPPVIVTPIDGMTDEQWAAAVERRERRWRAAFGAIVGALVGAVATFPASTWRWWTPRHGPIALLVVAGCSVLFAVLFAQQRDDEAIEHARWILFPEWYLVEKLPLWLLVAFFSVGVALAFLAIGLLVVVAAAR